MPRTFSTHLSVSALVTAMAFALPQTATAQDGPDMDEMRSSYETAVNEGDEAAVAQLYAEDAVILPPDADRGEGRAGVESYFTDFIEQRQPSELDITSHEDRQLGDAYLDTGTYSMTVSGPDGQEMQVSGDYASLVEQVGDEWVITCHIWNRDMPQ